MRQPIKGVCAVRGITAVSIAGKYGCSPHYVRQVWNGYVKPSLAFGEFVADLLGLPVEELFDEVWAS